MSLQLPDPPSPPTRVPVLKIKVSDGRSLDPTDNRRSWTVDITRTFSDESEPEIPREVDLRDPFTIADYDHYESSVRRSGRRGIRRYSSNRSDRSGSSKALPPLPQEESTESDLTADISNYASSITTDREPGVSNQPVGVATIGEYKQKLREVLGIDNIRLNGCIIKISICEDLHTEDHRNPHHSSIHSLLWELLEHDTDHDIAIEEEDPTFEDAALANQPPSPDVQVTRWITGIQDARDLPSGLLCPDDPIRLLLVIARSFQRPNDSQFRDVQSVVLDTLYVMSKYLRQLGRHQRLRVDVVRPGTLVELEQHLRRGGKYDLVHLDVHGWVESPSSPPQLLFARPDSYTMSKSDKKELDPDMFSYIPAKDVARLLKRHHIPAVALSACLSSYAHGKPLSNACRVFAEHGVCAVTGMSFTVNALTAAAYYTGFYTALVLANHGFRSAAVQGRRSLQNKVREIREKERKEKLERQTTAQRRRLGRRRSGGASSASSRVPDIVIEGQQEETTWPTATTYFATHNLDRTNSAKFGVYETNDANLRRSVPGSSPSIKTAVAIVRILASSAWCLASLLVCIGMALALTQGWNAWNAAVLALSAVSLVAWWRWTRNLATRRAAVAAAQADPVSAFEDFVKTSKTSRVEHSVALMALEDRLKTLGQLFVQVFPPGLDRVRLQHLNAIKDLWLTTGFADKVEIVPAWWFKRRWLAWFCFHLARHVLARCCTGWMTTRPSGKHGASVEGDGPKTPTTPASQTVVPEESSGQPQPPPVTSRTILIINELEDIVEEGKVKSWLALDRINVYIQSVAARDRSGVVYLMFMSKKDVGWLKTEWDAGRYQWKLAGYFYASSAFRSLSPRKA